jgi:nucleoside-diphosphate-sugar epimerase
MNDLHVVLGAGQIGSLLVSRLVARGERVRWVRRGAFSQVEQNMAAKDRLELLSGDLSDAAFATQALQAATVAYQCVNAPYHLWDKELRPLILGTLEGAKRAKTKMVVLDNLYSYGKPPGPMHEGLPHAPCSHKGRLRAELADKMLLMHQRGDVQLTIGRAADFFGPKVTQSIIGERYFQRVLAGKKPEYFGNADMPHSYSFSEDVADGLLALGAADGDAVCGQIWHLPVATPVATTTRSIMQQLGSALGSSAKPVQFASWAMLALSPFVPALGALREMVYQWEQPYVVDDSKFQRTFGLTATPLADALTRTAAWAKATYAS